MLTKTRSSDINPQLNPSNTTKRWNKNESDHRTCTEAGCDKIFPTQKRLDYHKNTWHDQVQCDICHKTMRKQSLVNHFRQQHRNTKRERIACSDPNCKKTFATEKSMNGHMWTRHKKKECEICHKLVSVKQYRPHLNIVHFNQEQCVCDFCGATFKTKTAFKNHVQTQHKENDREQCNICKIWLKHKISLRHHQLTKHSPGYAENPVTCPVCGKIKGNKGLLAAHMTSHNPDYKKRFECNICAFLCCNRTHLRRHQAIHNPIRLSQMMMCEYCEKKFLSKSGLSVSSIVERFG